MIVVLSMLAVVAAWTGSIIKTGVDRDSDYACATICVLWGFLRSCKCWQTFRAMTMFKFHQSPFLRASIVAVQYF
jgi:hypothetical protein